MLTDVQRLPKEILDAGFRRQEGFNTLELHPECENQRGNNEKAYKILKSSGLTRDEIDAVESAWGYELSIYFEVGYALGLTDGIATGQAVGRADALTR